MKKEIKLRSTLDLYKQMKVIGTSGSCPRRGYYQIKEVADELEPSTGCQIKVAKAVWKLEKDEAFNENNTVFIQLETFSRNPFPGSKEQLANILGRVIQVRSLYIDKSNEQSRLVCKWGVMDTEESIIALEDLKIEEQIQNHQNEIEESNIELQNAVLDQIEYMEEWDNYESNFILDIEEHQIKIEQEAANRLSTPSA